jgi:hypothetical protein
MGEERPLTGSRETCGVCQFPVEAGEEQTRCPRCGLPFHAECWEQNYGCSAYGCPLVNALKPAGPAAATVAAQSLDGPAAKAAALAPDPFPWDFLFLGASALSALVGLVAYGVPCVVVLVVHALAARALGVRKGHVGVLVLCVLVCLAGAVGGVLTSRWVWGLAEDK